MDQEILMDHRLSTLKLKESEIRLFKAKLAMEGTNQKRFLEKKIREYIKEE